MTSTTPISTSTSTSTQTDVDVECPEPRSTSRERLVPAQRRWVLAGVATVSALVLAATVAAQSQAPSRSSTGGAKGTSTVNDSIESVHGTRGSLVDGAGHHLDVR